MKFHVFIDLLNECVLRYFGSFSPLESNQKENIKCKPLFNGSLVLSANQVIFFKKYVQVIIGVVWWFRVLNIAINKSYLYVYS